MPSSPPSIAPGGPLDVDGAGWTWAYPPVSLHEMAGHLVLSCDTEPDPRYQFFLIRRDLPNPG